MTAAVESIEGEKEQEGDLISQAKEIENQKRKIFPTQKRNAGSIRPIYPY